MRLETRSVAVSFDGNDVLTNVSFTVEPGIIVLLGGANGAGKTTLLNVISGLISPLMGEVRLGGTSTIGLKVSQIARLGVSRVLQFPRLIQSATVLENVMFGAPNTHNEHVLTSLFQSHRWRRTDAQIRIRAMSILRELNLEHRSSSIAATLSFGERKLVALARAVLQAGTCLLLDEILSGLGETERTLVVRQVMSIAKSGAAVLAIEHESIGWQESDVRQLQLEHGQVYERHTFGA